MTAKMEIMRQKELVSYDSMTGETRTDVDIEEIKSVIGEKEFGTSWRVQPDGTRGS